MKSQLNILAQRVTVQIQNSKFSGQSSTMRQFPAFMTEYPSSTTMIPTSFLLPSQWPQPHTDELLLAAAESEFEDKLDEIRKMNNNLPVIGRTNASNEKEDLDNDADEEEADNAEESEGEEFEQETS
uniref:Uncharacterized protein n=1 Tax=Kalanchoe fedtschenkoi TaxID=63787 RepID=A0A7N0T5F6_KALFE